MFIAIRKEPNGKIYIDKNIYSRTETLKLTLDGYIQFKKENPNLEYTFTEAKEWVETPTIIFNEETQTTETKRERELVHFVYVTKRVHTDEELANPPYNYTKVEIDEQYKDCLGSDFNEDLTFSIEKYNARKQAYKIVDYENLIVSKIRKKYSLNQELAVLRQRDSKPEEYQEYFDYVEQCKKEAKEEVV